jgi:hypothetical protein
MFGATVRGEQPGGPDEDGRRDVALVYSVCESARVGRFVALDEVEELRVDVYQRDVDADLGLIEVPGLD